jgi:transcriptional regulator with XRE-family HTH domain
MGRRDIGAAAGHRYGGGTSGRRRDIGAPARHRYAGATSVRRRDIDKPEEIAQRHPPTVDWVRFGRGIRALRRRRHWRQRDLAEAAGCSRSLIARVELGRGDVLTGRSLEQIARRLGARVAIRLEWNGEALDRLLDQDHASLVEVVVRALRVAGWEVITEATFAIDGERGSVDVLAWHPATRSLLVIEVKSVVADAQDTLARLGRKVRLAPRIAPAEWRPRTVSVMLVVGESRTNRRRIEALGATFAAAFPDRIATIRRFIADPGDRVLRGLWFLSAVTQANARHRIRHC